ncbi:precorrin-6A reductase [Spirochaetia bacterium]|nr:precorrin-6A reductase [Spirochaetia bacterium]
MAKALIFGGTTEGRLLCEACAARGIAALYCVATELGILRLPGITVRVGRLDAAAMTALILQEDPALVLDATHPYAAEVSANIREACAKSSTPRIRVLREEEEAPGCHRFSNRNSLLAWLEETPGVIFAATGAKEAGIFTGLSAFRERVWFRMLPGIEGLRACLELGYPSAHLICMQGPFSRELNRAMFAAAGAAILVTKNSGPQGGFAEKLDAAGDLGMRVALLTRPPEPDGMPLERALRELAELAV